MKQAHAGVIVEHLRKLVAVPSAGPTPDRELLERFASRQDEAAFATLVQRHGPMVLRVGQRLLHNGQDAEDVCQAAFLVLASQAASRHWHESVAGWLYQVAYHLALKTRAAAACRRARESRAVPRGTTSDQEQCPDQRDHESHAGSRTVNDFMETWCRAFDQPGPKMLLPSSTHSKSRMPMGTPIM